MRTLPTSAAIASAALLAGCATVQSDALASQVPHGLVAPPATASAPKPPAPSARAELMASDGTRMGQVTAYSGPRGVLFRVEGSNWPTGWHGVHLHEVGRCEGPGFTSAGAHANHPEGPSPHGLLNSEGGPDLGDLQNVHAASDGTVNAEVYAANPGQIVTGLSFLVHANPDDHFSQPIGGAGPRIACGVFEPLIPVAGHAQADLPLAEKDREP